MATAARSSLERQVAHALVELSPPDFDEADGSMELLGTALDVIANPALRCIIIGYLVSVDHSLYFKMFEFKSFPSYFYISFIFPTTLEYIHREIMMRRKATTNYCSSVLRSMVLYRIPPTLTNFTRRMKLSSWRNRWILTMRTEFDEVCTRARD